MTHLLCTIECYYYVVTLIAVGCVLKVRTLQRALTMAKHKKVDAQVAPVDNAQVAPVDNAQVAPVAPVAPAAVSAVVTVAKVLLAVAGMLPPVETVIKGNKLPNPLHLPHGASKRAMALAVYQAVTKLGYGDSEVKRLSGILLVLTGVGYCHATGKVLVGEVHGSRGLAGYIKPNAAWWGTTSNTAKAVLVQAYANGIVEGCIGDARGDYAKALPMAESMMQRYITVYGEESINLD